MTKEKNLLVNALLRYQDKKNNIVKNHSGLMLIPKRLALSKEQVEDNVDKIVDEFRSNDSLATSNCLHCCIWHKDNCEGCPYDDAGENCMRKSDSLYERVVSRVKGKNTEYAAQRKGKELMSIGGVLMKSISKYEFARDNDGTFD